MNPTEDERRTQIETNILLVRKIQGEQNPRLYGWAVVSLFYAALHAVELRIIEKGGEPARNHSDRRKTIHSVSYLKKCARDYEALYQSSRMYRYDCQPAREGDIELAYQDYEKILRAIREQ